MSLDDTAPTGAIHTLANASMFQPAQRPAGWGARFVALLRTIVGNATGALRRRGPTPAITSRADQVRWEAPGADPSCEFVKLGRGTRGIRGTVFKVGAEAGAANGIDAAELERRLLEIGFVEGAAVEILHEGFIRRDPIAVRLDDMRVALRRRDADAILLRVGGESLAVVDAGE